jgi:dihydroorotase
MPEHFELVVRNGTLVAGDGRRSADIGVRDGRIAAIAEPGMLAGTTADVIDAAGCHVLPGLIDGHVHFRQPGLEHKEDWLTGSRAAAMGGVTTVLEMPNTVPPTATEADAVRKVELADAQAYTDFGLFGLLGSQPDADLRRLSESRLIIGLKVFLGPTTGELEAPTDEALVTGLALAGEHDLRVAFHAEDRTLIAEAEERLRSVGRPDPLAHLESRPAAAEVAAIDQAGRLLADAGAAGHILHISSAAGLDAIEAWRAKGVDLTCEVSAHHCLLSADDYDRLGGLLKCNPPIREAGEAAALLAALADGRIDCLASDHAPHAPDEKLPIDDQVRDIWRVAAGIAGVETTLGLMLTHGVNAERLGLERLVSAFAERPAQVWGLWPRKGSLAIGADGDMTIVDLQREGVIRGAALHGKHGLTPFDGWSTRGAAVATIVRGRVVMREGHLTGEPGWGRLAVPASRADQDGTTA